MARRGTARSTTLIFGLATLLAACTSGGGDADGERAGGGGAGEAGDGEPSTADAGGTTEQEFQLTSAAHPSLSVEVPDSPIATAPAESDGFSIDVFALQRESEKSVVLVFGLRNDSDGAKTFQRELEDPAVEAPVNYAISGVSLFDAVNLKRHLVFLDEEGGCLCSTTSTVTVDPGDTLSLAALFPAPPADVEAMTVQTPIGAVSDVPLADG